MRVVHVVVAGEVGGAERMLSDLVQGADHTVALVTRSDALRRLLRRSRATVIDRGPAREGPLTYLARSLGPLDVRWLTGVLKGARADVAHLHTFASQVLGTRAAKKAGVKVLRTEHSTRVYDDPSCWPFSKWSLERADAAVCVSQHVKNVALRKAPWAASKLRVVPNGVDLERFTPVAVPDLPRTRFLALGRLDPRKGLDLALEALAQVEDAELVIVGDGDEREALEQRALDLGVSARVDFVGWMDDPRPAIEGAHVALSSARSEGLGIALLEAMAMGRPVVAFPTGGIPEFTHDGETGWLATATTPDALARAMRGACADRGELVRRGEAARALVETKFSLASMRDGYAEAYASL